MDNRQAKPSPSIFCSEERVEDSVHVRFRNAWALIANLNHKAIVLRPGGKPNIAALRHGLRGVQGQVQYDLGQLLLISQKRWNSGRVLLVELDAFSGGVTHQVDH